MKSLFKNKNYLKMLAAVCLTSGSLAGYNTVVNLMLTGFGF